MCVSLDCGKGKDHSQLDSLKKSELQESQETQNDNILGTNMLII